MINPNTIGSDRLHERGIETALGAVDKRIIGKELISNTCKMFRTSAFMCFRESRAREIFTLDVELIAVAGEKLGSFYRDGRNGIDCAETSQDSQQKGGAKDHGRW